MSGDSQNSLGDTGAASTSSSTSASEPGPDDAVTSVTPMTSSSVDPGTSSSVTTTTTTTDSVDPETTGREDDSESSGGETDTTRGLTNGGVIARYFLNEAGAGTAPLFALDSTPAPIDLSIDYGRGSLEYVEELGNRGLEFTNAGSDDGARAFIGGTELGGLEGSTSLTFEVVFRLEDTVGQGSRIMHIGAGPAPGIATLSSTNPDLLQFSWNDGLVREWDYADFAGVAHVLHVVVDTTAPSPESQVRLLVEGAELVPEITGTIPVGDQAAVPEGTIFGLGNRDAARAIDGVLFYAAVYGEAIDDDRIAQHVTALGMSND